MSREEEAGDDLGLLAGPAAGAGFMILLEACHF